MIVTFESVIAAPKVDNHAKHFTHAQEKELLDIHNKYREGEGASDMVQMKWNNDLEKMAQVSE